MADNVGESRKIGIVKSKFNSNMNVFHYGRNELISRVESKIYRLRKLISIIEEPSSDGNGNVRPDIRYGGFSPEILKSLLEDCTEEEKMLLYELMELVEKDNPYNSSQFRNDISASINVIASFDSDEDVAKYMAPYAEEFGAGVISKFLIGLKDDKIRQELFMKYRSGFNKNNRYNKSTYLDKVLHELAQSFESDECILEILKEIEKKKRKESIIALLHSDDKKLELMEEYGLQDSGVIIASLDSEQTKLDMLSSGINFSDTDEILMSLSSDELKLEQLELRPEMKNKGRVIASFSSNEKKAELFSTLDIKGQIEVALSMEPSEETDRIIKNLLTRVGNKEDRDLRYGWATEVYAHQFYGRFDFWDFMKHKNYSINSKKSNDKNYSDDDYDKTVIDYIQASLVTKLSSDQVKDQVIEENPNTLGKSKFLGYMLASYESDDKKYAYIESYKQLNQEDYDIFTTSRQQDVVSRSLSKDKERSKSESIVHELKYTLGKFYSQILSVVKERLDNSRYSDEIERDNLYESLKCINKKHMKYVNGDTSIRQLKELKDRNAKESKTINSPTKKNRGKKRRLQRAEAKEKYRRTLIEKGEKTKARKLADKKAELDALKEKEVEAKKLYERYKAQVDKDKDENIKD